MTLIYFLFGWTASSLGAIPLGASNIAVINTTIKHNFSQAMKISFAAAIAEMILAYYALHCNMAVQDFFNRYKWIQIGIVIILMILGAILFFKKQKRDQHVKSGKISGYLTGFILGLLNPPVLIYWILVFGFLNGKDLMLSLQSPLLVLVLFFIGVYLGKFMILYLYSRFSLNIKNKVSNVTLVMNKITGILLVIIAIAQAIKLGW